MALWMSPIAYRLPTMDPWTLRLVRPRWTRRTPSKAGGHRQGGVSDANDTTLRMGRRWRTGRNHGTMRLASRREWCQLGATSPVRERPLVSMAQELYSIGAHPVGKVLAILRPCSWRSTFPRCRTGSLGSQFAPKTSPIIIGSNRWAGPWH